MFDRAAGFLPPRPQISDADARRSRQGRPSLRHRRRTSPFPGAATWPSRDSTPLCPERTQLEIGAGRIARSSRPVPAGTAFRRKIRRRYVWIASVQAAEDPASALHWNVVSVVHMRWRMTASLRATAMVAFLAPTRLPRVSPHVFSALGRAERLSNTLAASNRRQRTMPSPHLEIRPA